MLVPDNSVETVLMRFVIQPSLDDGSLAAQMQPLGADREDQPLEELDRAPLSSGVDIGGPLGGPGDELTSSPPQMELSLPSSTQPVMPPQVELVDDAAANTSEINGEQPPDVALRQYASPSPTPSEHGSASKVTNTTANDDTRPPSPLSSVFPDSDPRCAFHPRIPVHPTDHARSTRSSPSSSTSNSVVFVSADGIPDYIRENRAILVATSAGSPSSGRTPLRLSSESSLDSLDVDVAESRMGEARVAISDEPKSGHRLHCRICLVDPCEDMTATICGHLFCKRCVDALVNSEYEPRRFLCRCITQAVIAKSECPVCKNATLLYCLFKLDLSV